MADVLFRSESAEEFFKHEVEVAMQRQRVHASDWTIYYIVRLLSSYVRRPESEEHDNEPLGIRLARALAADNTAQRDPLRQIADQALFVAGFFGDSLERRAARLDYYISVGGFAYGRLAGNDDDAFADVFGELAEKFVLVVDVLSDISDRASRTNRDLLRVYERWLRTGSRRDPALLVAGGLSAPASRTVQ